MWLTPVILAFIFNNRLLAVIGFILNTVFDLTHCVRTPACSSDARLIRPVKLENHIISTAECAEMFSEQDRLLKTTLPNRMVRFFF